MKKTHWTAKDIEQLQLLAQGCISLDTPMKAQDGEESELGILVESREPSPEDVAIESEKTDILYDAITKVLGPREIAIMTLRYGLQGNGMHTLQEIGTIYGVTRERVRQIELHAVRKLRLHFAKLGIRGDMF